MWMPFWSLIIKKLIKFLHSCISFPWFIAEINTPDRDLPLNYCPLFCICPESKDPLIYFDDGEINHIVYWCFSNTFIYSSCTFVNCNFILLSLQNATINLIWIRPKMPFIWSFICVNIYEIYDLVSNLYEKSTRQWSCMSIRNLFGVWGHTAAVVNPSPESLSQLLTG